MKTAYLFPMMVALFGLGLANIFLRSSMGVLAPELARELALTPALLGGGIGWRGSFVVITAAAAGLALLTGWTIRDKPADAARAMVPEHLVGRGMTTVNTGVMISIALMQIAVGAIIGAFPDADGQATGFGYRAAFWFIAVMAFVTFLAYLRVPDRRPGD